MTIDFSSVHNHHEQAVFDQVTALTSRYPSLNAELLVDAACIALNKLKAHYIRHDVDLTFYMPDGQREQNAIDVRAAVQAALAFVQSRELAKRG